MQMTQTAAHAPRVAAVAARTATVTGCLGCADCRGMCRALIDLLTIPEAVAR